MFSLALILPSICFEYMLRQIPNTYIYKQALLEEKGAQIKNLIIGSSVVNCGINPAYLSDSTYNLAISGQWSRYNQAFLEKYINHLPRLQNIFWGISYQTLWIDDSVEQDKTSIAYHKIYMDISADNNLLYNIELISTGSISFRKWSKYYLLHKETMHCDSLGVDHSYDLAEKSKAWLEDIPRLIKGHNLLKNEKAMNTFRQNIRRLNEVAKLCHDRRVNLYLVIPPVYKKYCELAKPEQIAEMHTSLKEIADKWNNVYLYDYFNDARFGEDDFFNGNHLSSDTGAMKFTKILQQDVWGRKIDVDEMK